MAKQENRNYTINQYWRLALVDLGLNESRVLRRARLPLDLFGHDYTTLTTPEFFQFWRGMEEESQDPDIGLKFSSSVSVETFEPVFFAAFCSPDLNTALDRIALYKRLLFPNVLDIAKNSQETSLCIEWIDKSCAPPVSLVIAELVFFVQLSRLGTRQHIIPLEVIVPKLPANVENCNNYFGVSIKEGAKPKLSFSCQDAHRPFLTKNERMWEIFEPDFRKRLSDLDARASTGDRVRAALLESIPAGLFSVDTIARNLGESKRTLQRKLKNEGQSFQQILNRTREELANQYLKNSTLTNTEISFLLGYDEPNSFFRAYSNWTGESPERTRLKLNSATESYQLTSG